MHHYTPEVSLAVQARECVIGGSRRMYMKSTLCEMSNLGLNQIHNNSQLSLILTLTGGRGLISDRDPLLPADPKDSSLESSDL